MSQSSLRYTSLKALRHPDKIGLIRRGIPTGPTHVLLVLSDLCNQNCHFCSYRDPTYVSSQLFHEDGNYNPNRKLPREKAIEILDDCQELGAKGIQFTGGGEPTVHPDFQELVDYTSTLGLRWGLITNGVRLNRFDVSHAAWVRISIDAGRPETYARIRQVPTNHWDLALKSVQREKCGVGFIATPENWTEMYACAELVKSLGASNIRIGPQFSEQDDHLFDGFLDDMVALSEATKTLSDENFKVYSRMDKIDEIKAPPEDSLCGYQYFTTHIGADQNLYRCCIYAYNPYGLVGTLKGKRLKDVWMENWQGISQFDATKCKGCHYKDINRTLAYALSESAVDDEFV